MFVPFFLQGDVVRMHYLGYRVRENDTNVYCLRSEKISTAETTNRPDPSAVMLQRSTRTRKPNVLYHEKYVKSVKLRYRQRRVPSKAAMAAQPHQERGANLVKKKAQLESDRSDIQGPSQLHTSSMFPESSVPDWVQRGQQAQPLQFPFQQRGRQPSPGDAIAPGPEVQ